jgi:hypothetical protein
VLHVPHGHQITPSVKFSIILFLGVGGFNPAAGLAVEESCRDVCVSSVRTPNMEVAETAVGTPL